MLYIIPVKDPQGTAIQKSMQSEEILNLLMFEVHLIMPALFTTKTSLPPCFIASCVGMGVPDECLRSYGRMTMQAALRTLTRGREALVLLHSCRRTKETMHYRNSV